MKEISMFIPIAIIPVIQNALPIGTGWSRNTSAHTIPPRLPIPPTMPLCGNVNLRCPAYNEDLTMKPLEEGLQWGTSEKLTPAAASLAVATTTIIPITVATEGCSWLSIYMPRPRDNRPCVMPRDIMRYFFPGTPHLLYAKSPKYPPALKVNSCNNSRGENPCLRDGRRRSGSQR
jgi:hypothetical protein